MVETHLRALYSYCLTRMCDPHRAEELAQETLLRAYQAYPSLQDPTRFYPWLLGIARRCSWTWWRKKKRNPVDLLSSMESDSPIDSVSDEKPNPAEKLQNSERQQALMKVLQRLSQNYREVVILRYFEELSYADIALRLNLSIDTVDQRLTRAKWKLRQWLHPMEF